MYVIYGLQDPRSNRVFYVGMTDNVFKRFVAHIHCSGNNYEKNAYIQELRLENALPLFVELERTENIGLARVREIYWINHYRMLGHPITNIRHATLRFVKNVLVRSPKKLGQTVKIVASRETTNVEFHQTPRRLDAKSDARLGHPRMDEIQAAQFIAGYRIRPSIDFNLGKLKLGSGYREHARELIRQEGL